MSISAMKCALQSLESVEKVNGWNKDSIVGRHCTQSAHFLRQAIAEAEKPKMRRTTRDEKIVNPGVYEVPEFECPRCGHCCPERHWVGLTDEERRSLREWQEIQKELGPVWAPMMLYLYLAIEDKLKEKNT